MSRPRKYVMGPVMREPLLVIQEVIACRYVFLRDRPVNPAFVTSMQVWTVVKMARSGCFALALPNPDHPENKKELTDV